MQTAYVVTGSVTDSRTLHLDESLPILAGRVRLVIEVVEGSQKMSHDEFMACLRERQKARGHVPLTRAEVDAYLKGERESWDD